MAFDRMLDKAEKQPHTKRLRVVAALIARNEAHALERFYREFPKDAVDEIFLVDNASEDGTFELAKKLGIEAYRNEHNLGYGGNMKRALDIALEKGAEVVVDIHPDGEYLPSAIAPALAEVSRGAEFVLGNRFAGDKKLSERGMFFWKILPLISLNWLCRIVLRLPIRDLHQGFRVYTRALLEKVAFHADSNAYLFSFELIAQAADARVRFAQVPVETRYQGRKRGASLYHTVRYSLGIFVVLAKFVLAQIGLRVRPFTKVSPAAAAEKRAAARI